MLEDYTGSLPTHKMTGEIIPPSEFANGNLVLSKGSFFLDSLTLINVNTGEELIKNRDWKPRVLDSAATGHTGGKLIYSLIELTNTPTASISATYQYVGGSKVQQRETIINLLDTLGDTELSRIYYSNLKNRPHSFDVTEEHLHDASQVTGKDEEIAALANIHQSLERIGDNVALGVENDLVKYIVTKLNELATYDNEVSVRLVESRNSIITLQKAVVSNNIQDIEMAVRLMRLEATSSKLSNLTDVLEKTVSDSQFLNLQHSVSIIKSQTGEIKLMRSQFLLNERIKLLENN
ncbi:hypothetical protein TSMG0055 [Halocynthia phage JM-2012]|uniref:hypothetical protein n=1 Tax=Halocynthia phage JM-2012 TaxID=1173297 RepID=UPI00025C690B|nr:hypothetical protein TSMG0055 [Halocynthia phage JM-2012]AFI55338.1 hypothetical protein TSMG0055 [Halocynthia phage JM-2012]